MLVFFYDVLHLTTKITKGALLLFWACQAIPAVNTPTLGRNIQDKHYHERDQGLHTVFLLSRVTRRIER